MHATTASPFHTAVVGAPARARGIRRSGHRPVWARVQQALAAYRPRWRHVVPFDRSRRRGNTTIDHAAARATICAYNCSRTAGVSSLESASPSISPRRPGGSTHAATTRGPAQAPRPASSAPAIVGNPARRSAVSYAHKPDSRRTIDPRRTERKCGRTLAGTSADGLRHDEANVTRAQTRRGTVPVPARVVAARQVRASGYRLRRRRHDHHTGPTAVADATAGRAVAPAEVNVLGVPSVRHRDGGHAMITALPMTSPFGTVLSTGSFL